MNFIYITSSTKEEAIKIAKHLLEKKLIACANIFPIESLYWWEGKITEEKEVVLITKTSDSKFEEVKDEVEKIHSYSIPCTIKIPVSSNKKFSDWLESQVKQKR